MRRLVVGLLQVGQVEFWGSGDAHSGVVGVYYVGAAVWGWGGL